MSQNRKTFNDLDKDIIKTELCVSCGTCEALCPVSVILLEESVPKLVGKCIECGICYANCPVAEFNEIDMELKIFGRTRKPEENLVGVYQKAYSARATLDKIHEKAQDGGVVSALLIQFLNEGGDGVIVSRLDENEVWLPKPVIAKNSEEIIQAAGTKYTPSPTMVAVKKAVKEENLKKIAVVGTTCQMKGLSLATNGPLKNKKFEDSVDLKIGLFCMETFGYDSFMKYLKEKNIDPSKITKFEIKKGRFFAWAGDENVLKTKLSEVKSLVRPTCSHCSDFASEFADISVGNVGSSPGYSTVIVRTDKGKAILESSIKSGLIEAEILEEFEKGDTLVHRLAETKKNSHK